MPKKQDMINDLIAHADAGTGVDYDGMYGYQCADVTCYGPQKQQACKWFMVLNIRRLVGSL